MPDTVRKDLAAGSFDGCPCITALIGIDQKIRLKQDLMIQPVYIRIGMVMAHDPRNALHIGGIDRQRRKNLSTSGGLSRS